MLYRAEDQSPLSTIHTHMMALRTNLQPHHPYPSAAMAHNAAIAHNATITFQPPFAPSHCTQLRGPFLHPPLLSPRLATSASWLSHTARRTRRLLTRLSPFRVIRRPRIPDFHIGRPGANGNANIVVPPTPSVFLNIAASVYTDVSLVPHDNAPSPMRIMFLISDTGGGHRASAQALAAAFEELYPGRIDSLIVDFWTEIVGRPFVNFPQGYSFLAKNPPLWRAAWNYGRFPITRRLTEEFANVVGNQNFRNALADFQPDLIVSVHPLTQFIPLRVLRTLENRPPFVTVCTDLGGAHPTWFHRDVDLCFVPSDNVRRIALRCGLKDNQLRQFGLPVRPAFWQDGLDKHTVRVELGLLPDAPVILVVGGGDGVGGVGRISATIANRLAHRMGSAGAQVVIVCGKNERLRAQLEKKQWPIPVIVNGFVQNMSELMTAADLVVSKAGPGTIAEALIRGLPIVLSGFLPGQEAPNVSLVTRAGVGAFSRDPGTIADIVADWVADPVALQQRAKRAKDMGRPNATYDIVREIGKLTGLETSADVEGPLLGAGIV